MAERIVGVTAFDYVVGLAVAFQVLLIDILGHNPGGILGFGDDRPVSYGSLPIEAAESYRKALELRSDYGLVHYKLGLLYEDNQPAEAIKEFEKYLASGKNTGEFVTEAKSKIEKLKNVTTQKSQGQQ